MLTYTPLRGAQGILSVKLTSGKYCRIIDQKDIKDTEGHYRAGSSVDPIAIIRNNQIEVKATSPTTIDVSYLRLPTAPYFSFTSDAADSGSSTTKFDGASGEGLSTSNDAYNDAVIYNEDKETYHVVTDYNGTSLEFTVSPAASSAFPNGQTFRFITNGFDATNLSGVEFDLNESFHNIIVDLAESFGLAQTDKDQQRIAAENRAANAIRDLNAIFVPRDLLGG